MKTIGTKLDNDEFEEFLEICNEEGCSKSELLRKLVKDHIRETNDFTEDENETSATLEPKVDKKPIVHAKIIEIDGVPVSEIKNPRIVEI